MTDRAYGETLALARRDGSYTDHEVIGLEGSVLRLTDGTRIEFRPDAEGQVRARLRRPFRGSMVRIFRPGERGCALLSSGRVYIVYWYEARMPEREAS